jgi:hypothetical protein
MIKRYLAFVLALTAQCVVLAVGCASSASNAAPAESKASEPVYEVEKYFPLTAGTVFAYDTVNEDTGEKGLLVFEVVRPRPGRADLKVGGQVKQRLELRSDGISHLEGGYLLKTPLTTGSQWKGRWGTVTVNTVDRSVETRAGHFVGCIETVEEAQGAGGGKRATSVYCPEVGLVSLDAEGDNDTGYAHERATLRSFGPRVDLGAVAEPSH